MTHVGYWFEQWLFNTLLTKQKKIKHRWHLSMSWFTYFVTSSFFPWRWAILAILGLHVRGMWCGYHSAKWLKRTKVAVDLWGNFPTLPESQISYSLICYCWSEIRTLSWSICNWIIFLISLVSVKRLWLRIIRVILVCHFHLTKKILFFQNLFY